MNKKRTLLGLIIFVSISTLITIAFTSGRVSTIQVKAYGLFHGQSDAARSFLPKMNSSQESANNISSSKGVTNITGQLHKANNSQASAGQLTPAPLKSQPNPQKKPEPATPAPQKPDPTNLGRQKPAKPTNRPLQCQNCFKPTLANLTAIPDVCANGSGSSTPEMLMMITTTLNGIERRKAIRETWASVTRHNTAHVRHVFLLGTDKEGKVSQEIHEESARFKDIMVANFVDVYGNLTYKTLAGMHFLVEHCSVAKYFLKTDQDMYVFPQRLLDLAKKNDKNLQTSLGGACYQTGRPWRDPRTKYYASVQSYPQSTYPGFCSGTGYIGSFNVAKKIVEVSPNIPFFHLEDVYLSLVLRHVRYRLTKYPGFAEGSGVCKMGGNRAKSTMTIHEVSPQTIRQMWDSKCGV